jgi:hypothetical protein
VPPKDSVNALPFPNAAEAGHSAKPSQIELEVMELFEQFRDPLLRYALSFGISVHDAEEVTQEVFLSLFRHFQLRKSRKNLRSWIFRVGHNLALKQLYANQRSYKTTSDRTIAEEQFDPTPNPEEQLSSAQRRHRLLANSSSSGCGSGLAPTACGGSPLPRNSSRSRNVSGSRIDIADTITGTVDPCGREIKLCRAKAFTCRTKKCFSRQTVNSQPAGPLEFTPTLPSAGPAALGWQKSKGLLPISRELTDRVSIPNYLPSQARVHY